MSLAALISRAVSDYSTPEGAIAAVVRYEVNLNAYRKTIGGFMDFTALISRVLNEWCTQKGPIIR